MRLRRKLLFATMFIMLTGAAHAVVVNPDGMGLDPAMEVRGLDWAPGNTLITPVGNASIFTHFMGDVFQLYSHASLSGFLDTGSTSIGGLGANRWLSLIHI